MWIIGAVIAAAGMQVYIVWGTVSPLFAFEIFFFLTRQLGRSQEWRREELLGVPVQEAEVLGDIDVCGEWCIAWCVALSLGHESRP